MIVSVKDCQVVRCRFLDICTAVCISSFSFVVLLVNCYLRCYWNVAYRVVQYMYPYGKWQLTYLKHTVVLTYKYVCCALIEVSTLERSWGTSSWDGYFFRMFYCPTYPQLQSKLRPRRIQHAIEINSVAKTLTVAICTRHSTAHIS